MRIAWALLLAGAVAFGQSRESSDEDFHLAEIAAHNIPEAITAHLADDASFQMNKKQPEDKLPDPPILLRKDGSFSFDWTPSQHARHLMEDLRQGIHALQSAQQARGLDSIALDGARKIWPKMRDIFCRDNPDVQYYDLDGIKQYCPAKGR
jgi:hypothetical protein